MWRAIAVVALAAMGLVSTPFLFFVLGSVLFAWHPMIGVAQGLGTRFTIYGILAAPLGAAYWLVVGISLVGRAPRSRARRWSVASWSYLGLLLGAIACVGFAR
jgi:hypothetical protein